MPRLNFRSLALALAASALSLMSSAQAAPELVPGTPELGKAYWYETTYTQSITSESNDNGKFHFERIHDVVSVEVELVEELAGGSRVFELEIVRVNRANTLDGSRSYFDTGMHPRGNQLELGDGRCRIAQMPLLITVDADGSVMEVEGIDRLLEYIQGQADGADVEFDPRDFFLEIARFANTTLNNIYPAMPKELSSDTSWTVPVKGSGAAGLSYELAFQVAETGEDTITATAGAEAATDPAHVMEVDGFPSRNEISGTHTGTMTIDPATRRVITSEFKQQFEGMRYFKPLDGPEFTRELKTDITYSVKQLKARPDHIHPRFLDEIRKGKHPEYTGDGRRKSFVEYLAGTEPSPAAE